MKSVMVYRGFFLSTFTNFFRKQSKSRVSRAHRFASNIGKQSHLV